MSTIYEKVMSNRIGSLPQVELSAEVAKQLYEQYQAEWQRPINKRRLNKIKADMEAGKFGEYSIVKLGQVGDTIKGLDGQHRFLAQALTGKSQKYYIQTIPFENWAEAQREYALHIDTGQPRRLSDALRALGLYKDKLHPTLLTVLGQSVSYIMKDLYKTNTTKQLDGEDIAIEVKNSDWDQHFKRILELFMKTHNEEDMTKLLRVPLAKAVFRAPVISIFMIFMDKMPYEANRFLKELFEEASPIGTPTNALRNFLISTRISGGGTTMRETHGVPKYLITRGIAKSWNNFINNEPMNIFSISDIKRGHVHPQGILKPDDVKLMV